MICIANMPRFFMFVSLYFLPICLAYQRVSKFCCTIHGKDKQMLSARKSIFGENIISCREFSLSTPKTFEYISSYNTLNSMPLLSLPEFAFIGRSNVGKSSLLNALTGAKKNVATQGKTPGTTKCINLFSCGDKSGPICTFVDLPGYGFAKLAKTVQDEISRFLRDYFLARGALKLVFLLVDSRREGNTLDQEMFSVSYFKDDHHFFFLLLYRYIYQFLVDNGVPVVIVATKVDKLSKAETIKAEEKLKKMYMALSAEKLEEEEEEEVFIAKEELKEEEGGVPVIMFSSVTGHGKGDIWKAIRDNMLYAG